MAKSLPRAEPPLQGQSGEPDRWERNRRHWDSTLDAHNVGTGSKAVAFERLVRLYDTADVRVAMDAMEPLEDALVLDVGGGLALAAALFARRGARVVICDLSIERLRAARPLVAEAGLADRVFLVAGRAEAQPFADASFDGVFAKSVLIHTRIEDAAAECGRLLKPGGRAAFVEPMQRNPFVNAYRALCAPKIWKDITTYFGPGEIAAVKRGLARGANIADMRTKPVFLFAFFASVFSFVMPVPALYRIAELALMAIDGVVFTVLPATRKYAWFIAMKASRPHAED